MDDAKTPIAAEPGPEPMRRGTRVKARRRARGAARRWLWAFLTFLMLVVGGVAACQAPGWLGPAHHEPGLTRPLPGARP